MGAVRQWEDRRSAKWWIQHLEPKHPYPCSYLWYHFQPNPTQHTSHLPVVGVFRRLVNSPKIYKGGPSEFSNACSWASFRIRGQMECSDVAQNFGSRSNWNGDEFIGSIFPIVFGVEDVFSYRSGPREREISIVGFLILAVEVMPSARMCVWSVPGKCIRAKLQNSFSSIFIDRREPNAF